MKKYEILDHTADYKVRAFGLSREELFRNAALGMFDFMYKRPGRKNEFVARERVCLNADKLDTLLVNWLSELLCLSDTNKLAYVKFDFNELGGNKLDAFAHGCKAELRDDIKAVTYHDLSIKKVNGTYEATVLFDI